MNSSGSRRTRRVARERSFSGHSRNKKMMKKKNQTPVYGSSAHPSPFGSEGGAR